jgi:hypothetical protein
MTEAIRLGIIEPSDSIVVEEWYPPIHGFGRLLQEH